ncbi:DHA2 family efflux MFS transporter permease subunit [Paenibacillus sp. MMS18-CY102]|uniref:DHA2 family efflux MFS transporter permease subunit n=1 Tax=Paenibacillus sp. MMS18-CY102 TaxID=2682849 RepID=UPI00136618FC|nr:DHA2 family efflux MFS transporter permease subunit [Paenibacillus sp. MMS18-CY102]MWC28340.1 DHA2 family efflux MFS transporter permease subunit [Paenibacillus sp. MMS18-CY102]
MATLFLGSFLSIYHVVSLNAVLPGFITIFHTDLSTAQWLMTGFTLATGMVAPVCAYLEERFGTRRLFLSCIVMLTVCSIICSFAWSIYSLIVFRTLQGIFCGILQPLTLSILYGTLPPERHSAALGWWTASTILGPALAPTISGWLQQSDWRLIFWVTVPIGLLVWRMGLACLPVAKAKNIQRPDFLSLSYVMAGTLALLMLFSKMNRWGLLSVSSLVCLTTALLFIGLFVRRSLRSEQPLLQLRLFNNRMFSSSLAASLILIVGLYSGIYFIPLFLQQVQGMAPLHVGLLLLPPALSMTLATTISTRYYKKLGPSSLLIAGSVLLMVATWQFSRLKPESGHGFVMLWMAVRYVGIGLSMTPAMNAGMSAVSQQLASHASALINWIRQAGGALAIGLFTAFFYSRISAYGGLAGVSPSTVDRADQLNVLTPYMHGLNDVFLLALLFTSLSIPLALLMRNRKRAAAGKPHIKEGHTG